MIAQTRDNEFIEECVTHQQVWDAISDDGYPSRELYFANVSEPLIWLRAGDLGVFLFHPHNLVTYEAHTILLPEARGHSVELAKQAIQWMFENSPCERLITNVPSFNQLALRLAKKAGMTEFGVNPKSFKKGGVLYDQTLLGISKGV